MAARWEQVRVGARPRPDDPARGALSRCLTLHATRLTEGQYPGSIRTLDRLGISRKTFWQKMKRHGLTKPQGTSIVIKAISN